MEEVVKEEVKQESPKKSFFNRLNFLGKEQKSEEKAEVIEAVAAAEVADVVTEPEEKKDGAGAASILG